VPVRALLLDFKGTLSDDEPLLCELFGDLFAEQGKPMTPNEYYDRLSGLADHDIVRTWLGRDDPAIVSEYVRRYIARAGDGSTIPADARASVRAARSAGVRLAVVSGAPHAAIDAALRGAGLKDLFSAIVAAEDVDHGNPIRPGTCRLSICSTLRPGSRWLSRTPRQVWRRRRPRDSTR
jgi:beta-phosphoglucomutase